MESTQRSWERDGAGKLGDRRGDSRVETLKRDFWQERAAGSWVQGPGGSEGVWLSAGTRL